MHFGQRNVTFQCEGYAVLVVPLTKEITTKKVNSLILSSMIATVQHILGRLSHTPTISAKAPLLTVSSAKSKFRRRRPLLSFIKHQDCSAIATACIHLRCVASFSFSTTAPANLGFKAGQQINLVMNRVNQFWSQSGCESGRNIYMYTCKMP